MRCDGCKWMSKRDSGKDFGECKRHPPVRAGMVNAYTYDHLGVWPLVRPDDWCGEFQAKPQ